MTALKDPIKDLLLAMTLAVSALLHLPEFRRQWALLVSSCFTAAIEKILRNSNSCDKCGERERMIEDLNVAHTTTEENVVERLSFLHHLIVWVVSWIVGIIAIGIMPQVSMRWF